MSSNPAPGAKEYLISLFDDNRKKVFNKTKLFLNFTLQIKESR